MRSRLRDALARVSADHVAVALIAAFALINLIGLDHLPRVHADESLIAEPGLRFWQRGVLVSDLSRGLLGVERHHLVHGPLFTLIEGWVVWVFGPGLLQVRLVTLAMGAAIAAMTYAVGRRLFSPRVGLIALVILLLWHVGPSEDPTPAGIPLVDYARFSRYDIAVPFFGLLGLMVILGWAVDAASTHLSSIRAPSTPARLPYVRLVLAGICAGLAVDSHPMGVISVATLIAVCLAATHARGTLWRDGALASACILAGTVLAMLPWFVFIYVGWDDFVAQQRFNGERRWALLDLRFYLSNAVHAWHRYGRIGRGVVAGQPGAWALLLGVVAGTGALVFGPWRDVDQKSSRRGRLLLAALVTAVALDAIGVQPKHFRYMAVLWPWIVLMAAVGIAAALDARSRALRVAAIGVLVIATAEGLVSTTRFLQRAQATTSYPALCDRFAALMPPDTRLLAGADYWLCLSPRISDYHNVVVVFTLLNETFRTPDTTIEQVLATSRPTVALLDQETLDYLHLAQRDPTSEFAIMKRPADDLFAYLAARTERQVDIVDPSLGRFVLYFLRPSPLPASAPDRATPR